jgi:hypothetical protein
MGDISLRHTRTGGRHKDHPLSTYLPPQVLAHLTQRNIHWVGQLATPDGLRLVRPITLGINPNVSTWWQQVVESLCTPGHPLLATPVSPTHSPITSLPSTQAPGSFVTMPDMVSPGSSVDTSTTDSLW